MIRELGISLLLAASCGGKLEASDVVSTDAAASPSPTASVRDAGAPEAAPAADPCNTLVQQAPTVYETSAEAAVPSANGGSVADGTYILTSDVVDAANPGSGAAVARVTLEVKGSTIDVVETSDAGEQRATFTFSTSDDLMHLTPTCVFGVMGDTWNTPGWRYTATSTELIEFEGGRNVLRSARTYTKQ